MNAGDPEGAYLEAADMGQAHNESFAVEAGAVMAAAAAAAFGRDASIESVLDAATSLARDGTARAARAAVEAADPSDEEPDFIVKVRRALEPYDPRERHVSDDATLAVKGASDVGRPSRLFAIEELPVALAVLKYGAGDWPKTIHAGVFYGRDCDSIAGMACALFGALFGVDAIPENLRKRSDEANRRDWRALAGEFATVIPAIVEKDAARLDARRKATGL